MDALHLITHRPLWSRPVKNLTVLLCLLALLSPAIALSGCTRALRFGPDGEITDPAALIEKLDTQAAGRRTLQSDAKVRIVSPEQRGSVDAFLALRMPGSIRMALLNFFGKPVADLLALPDHFQMHDVENRAVYVGEPTAQNLARVLVVPIAPSDAVQFLLGIVPRIDADQRLLQLDRDRRAYRLDLVSTASATRQTIFVDTETLRPVRVELRGRAQGYELDFSDFQRVNDEVDLPFKIHLRALDGAGKPLGIELTVQQRDAELNRPIDRRTFEPLLPENARVIDLNTSGFEQMRIPMQPDTE